MIDPSEVSSSDASGGFTSSVPFKTTGCCPHRRDVHRLPFGETQLVGAGVSCVVSATSVPFSETPFSLSISYSCLGSDLAKASRCVFFSREDKLFSYLQFEEMVGAEMRLAKCINVEESQMERKRLLFQDNHPIAGVAPNAFVYEQILLIPQVNVVGKNWSGSASLASDKAHFQIIGWKLKHLFMCISANEFGMLGQVVLVRQRVDNIAKWYL